MNRSTFLQSLLVFFYVLLVSPFVFAQSETLSVAQIDMRFILGLFIVFLFIFLIFLVGLSVLMKHPKISKKFTKIKNKILKKKKSKEPKTEASPVDIESEPLADIPLDNNIPDISSPPISESEMPGLDLKKEAPSEPISQPLKKEDIMEIEQVVESPSTSCAYTDIEDVPQKSVPKSLDDFEIEDLSSVTLRSQAPSENLPDTFNSFISSISKKTHPRKVSLEKIPSDNIFKPTPSPSMKLTTPNTSSPPSEKMDIDLPESSDNSLPEEINNKQSGFNISKCIPWDISLEELEPSIDTFPSKEINVETPILLKDMHLKLKQLFKSINTLVDTVGHGPFERVGIFTGTNPETKKHFVIHSHLIGDEEAKCNLSLIILGETEKLTDTLEKTISAIL